MPLIVLLLKPRKTYVRLGKRCKLHTVTILDDRMTRALQVDVTVSTLVHPELFACHYDHAILDSCHMCGPVDLATDQQALFDVFQRQTGQGFAADGGHGQVNDAAFE